MNFTINSQILMEAALSNKCIPYQKCVKKVQNIFKPLYEDIVSADQMLQKQENVLNKPSIKKINSKYKVIKPKTFAPYGLPTSINNYISNKIKIELCYKVSIGKRKITLYFLLEDTDIINTNLYNMYASKVFLWFLFIDQYASKLCSPFLTIYIYLTSLKKQLPEKAIDILGEKEVNTAFTKTCPDDSEIVIFRKEEWFKVLLHETFHNLGLDFSDLNNEVCTQNILNLFPIKSDINLYESYAEFWAKIMNALFCSYFHTNNYKEFIKYMEVLINIEITYNYFQMIKVLDFMNLNYNTLIGKELNCEIKRKTNYAETTNVFAYYVITLILLTNYNQFIEWCSNNNENIFQFKKTLANQLSLCTFIETKYKNKNFIKNINCMEIDYKHIKEDKNKNKNKNNIFLLNTLRMSASELI